MKTDNWRSIDNWWMTRQTNWWQWRILTRRQTVNNWLKKQAQPRKLVERTQTDPDQWIDGQGRANDPAQTKDPMDRWRWPRQTMTQTQLRHWQWPSYWNWPDPISVVTDRQPSDIDPIEIEPRRMSGQWRKMTQKIAGQTDQWQTDPENPDGQWQTDN